MFIVVEYDFILSGTATRFLLGFSDRLRRNAEAHFDSLRNNPHDTGNLQRKTGLGRTYYIKLTEDMTITYCVDHVIREIRVILVEMV